MKRYMVNLWRALLGKRYKEERWYLVETEDGEAIIVMDDGDHEGASVVYDAALFEQVVEGAGLGAKMARWRATGEGVFRIEGEVRLEGGVGPASVLLDRWRDRTAVRS